MLWPGNLASILRCDRRAVAEPNRWKGDKMKGRKPVPATIKLLEGNPGNREIQREPKPVRGLPQPPDYLDETGLKAWQEVLDMMGSSGAITMAEAPLLELYADTYSKFHKAREMVDKLGLALVEKDKDGRPKARANPFSSQLHRHRDAAMKLLIELGMTPVSRARIGLHEQQLHDPAAEFIA